jgi:hypothetical protein
MLGRGAHTILGERGKVETLTQNTRAKTGNGTYLAVDTSPLGSLYDVAVDGVGRELVGLIQRSLDQHQDDAPLAFCLAVRGRIRRDSPLGLAFVALPQLGQLQQRRAVLITSAGCAIQAAENRRHLPDRGEKRPHIASSNRIQKVQANCREKDKTVTATSRCALHLHQSKMTIVLSHLTIFQSCVRSVRSVAATRCTRPRFSAKWLAISSLPSKCISSLDGSWRSGEIFRIVRVSRLEIRVQSMDQGTAEMAYL